MSLFVFVNVQVEGIVWNTNSGSTVKFHAYYAYWEYRVYQSLVKLVVTNLRSFQNVSSHRPAYFRIHALLASPDVVIYPIANEVS